MPPRNGDIRSFFAGSQRSSQRTVPQAPVSQSPPARKPKSTLPHARAPAPAPTRTLTPEPQPSFVPPSSDSQEANTSITSSPPTAAPRRTYDRDAVIAASDDDDGSEASDLTDVFDIGAPKWSTTNKCTITAGRATLVHPCETPRAKRTIPVDEFLFSSPLTIQSKKHKYDMAALLRANETDESARESAQRFAELMEKERAEKEGRATAAAAAAAEAEKRSVDHGEDEENEYEARRQLKERMATVAAANATDEDEDEDGAGAKMSRIERALDRTGVTGGAKSYYFLGQVEPGADGRASTAGNAFPSEQAEGAWVILADAQDRTGHLESGFPYDIQKMFGNMPDEIFLWILAEVTCEHRRGLATEYVKLLRICDDQVRRLLSPALLQRLFRDVGATKDIDSLTSSVTLSKEVSDPYRNRSWICLENLLRLVGCISRNLYSETRTAAMQILLRMGMDNIAVENFGLAQEWRWAVDLVARSVPGNEWTNFCQEVCNSVFHSTEKAALRYRAISLLGPVQTPELPPDLQGRTLDLKRRLAAVFFFDDLARADKKPEDTVNIRAVVDRLEDTPFMINTHTNYTELHALMMTLNIALGDASRSQIATTPEASRDFDAQVDELAEGIKSMLTRIAPQSKGIHVQRIDAKSAMEVIRERLLYQVRTRQKPKIQGIRLDEPEEDYSVPKQQDFMKGYFLKKGKKDVVRPSIETETMV